MRALIVVLACLAAEPALAQDLGDALGDPGTGERAVRRSRPRRARGLAAALGDPAARRAPRPERREEPSRPWAGPQVQLSYVFSRLTDGYGGGDTHAAELSVFIQLPISEIRLGIHGGLGAHDFALGGDDLIGLAALEVGFQLTTLLEPFVPHLSLIVAFGGLVGERFDTTVAHGFGGAGVALGGEIHLIRNFHIGLELAYLRLEMDGAAFDVPMIRIVMGL